MTTPARAPPRTLCGDSRGMYSLSKFLKDARLEDKDYEGVLHSNGWTVLKLAKMPDDDIRDKLAKKPIEMKIG